MTTETAWIAQMRAALIEAERVIEAATDDLLEDFDRRVTPMSAEETEQVYFLLCGVLVQLHEAIRASEGGQL